jgi:EamA domain-containing membrane protein RarD
MKKKIMLEILILLGTCKKISSLCKERGSKPLNYNLLNILGYFLSIYGFFVLGFFLSDQFDNSSFPKLVCVLELGYSFSLIIL